MQTSKLITTIFSVALIILALSYYANFNNKNVIRSSLFLPNKKTLLERKELLTKINNKFNNNNQITMVALIGIGGSGKTTLARQYCYNRNSSVIWEINAENKESIELSFSELFNAIYDNREKIKVKNIKNIEKRKKYIFFFVKKFLKANSDWLLIYENVKNINNIIDYIPSNSNVWGKGKIIITTRNAHIYNSIYINPDNVIKVSILNDNKKLNLFTRIIGVKNIQKTYGNSNTVKFLKNIPPFPLDISIAAYYIKNTNTDYDQYLNYIKQYSKDFILTQKRLSEDNFYYSKTRYGIVVLSLKHLNSVDLAFPKLLFLVSLLDNSEIPKDLLSLYENRIATDKFLYHLRKHSLIIDDYHRYHPFKTFSIHSSTQFILYKYFIKTVDDRNLVKSMAENFIQYITNVSNKKDILLIRPGIKHVYKFLKKSNQILSEEIKCNIKNELGRMLYYMGNYKESKEIFNRNLPYYIQSDATDKIKIGWVLTYLGKIYRNLGDYKLAKQLLEQSLQIYKKHYGEQHVKTAWLYAHLGNINRSFGNYKVAKKLLKKSVQIYKKHYGEQHVKTAWIFVHLGDIYKCLGEYYKAKYITKQGYEIYLKNYGNKHTLTAWSATCLGKIYRHLKKYEKAKSIIENNLSVYKEQYGDRHIQTAWALRSLGMVLAFSGQIKQAEKLIVSSIKILKTANHCDVYKSIECLSDLYLEKSLRSKDKNSSYEFRKQSIKYLKDALSIVINTFSESSAHALRLKKSIRVLENSIS